VRDRVADYKEPARSTFGPRPRDCWFEFYVLLIRGGSEITQCKQPRNNITECTCMAPRLLTCKLHGVAIIIITVIARRVIRRGIDVTAVLASTRSFVNIGRPFVAIDNLYNVAKLRLQ
jgi:hypothetical protein